MVAWSASGDQRVIVNLDNGHWACGTQLTLVEVG
jgi:hypothetical protein